MDFLGTTAFLLGAVLLALAMPAGIWLYRAKTRRRRLARHPGDPAKDYLARRDWKRSTGKVNFSSFIYLDVDRDGVYGMSDRPMAGIVVRLARSGIHVRRNASNLNGFANFATSERSRNAPIHTPGDYSFEVSVPPGFVCTSANRVQHASFHLLPGSPSGIVAAQMLKPVGLAPIRYVTGTLADGEASISATRSGEVLVRQALAQGATFRFEPPEEADGIAIEGPDIGRTFRLGAYPVHLGVVGSDMKTIPADAPRQTIDFDDLTPGELKKIPSGYAGLDWFNLNVFSRDHAPEAQGPANCNVSGVHMCYTSSGHPAEIARKAPFGLDSVMVAAVWFASEGETACIECWNGDQAISKDEIVLSAMTPVRYAPALPQVTRIRISSRHCWQVLLDDLIVAL